MYASGLSTDIFFIAAVKSDADLMAQLPAHEVYNNVANPDVDLENVEIPYIIVNNDGGNNVEESKDDDYESPEDRVSISIRIVAKNRAQLDQLAQRVRKTINRYMHEMGDRIEQGEEPEDYQLMPQDYEFSFSDISFAPDKPCHTIMLYYACDVCNELNTDDDEQED